MNRARIVPSSLLALGLALALAAYTVASYPGELVAAIALGTALIAGMLVAGRWLWTREAGSLPDALGLLVLAASAMLTIQSLVARGMFGRRVAINMVPGYPVVVGLIYCGAVTCVVLGGRERSRLVAVGAAMVYSSLIFAPTFNTLEAGPSFAPLMALALALVVRPSRSGSVSRLTLPSRLLLPLLLFAIVALGASLLSYSMYESLSWWFRLITLLLLVLAVPRCISRERDWRSAAALVVALSVGLPALLAVAKFFELGWLLGAWSAIRHNVNLNELGGSNLMARTLAVGMPLLLAFALMARRRRSRAALWLLSGLAMLMFMATQSWVGIIALAAAVAFLILLKYGSAWHARWQTAGSLSRRIPKMAAISLLALLGLAGLLQLASRANVSSFNGRIFQYRAAVRQMAERPVYGTGPGHYYGKSQHTAGLNWLVDTQSTLDDPFKPVSHLRDSTTMHSHNLFLELGVGIGLLGMAAFVWLLFELFRFALQARARSMWPARALLTGSVAGLAASVGYGLFDVMEISPPFFTFPTWALAGLLLAAPLAFRLQAEEQAAEGRPRLVGRLLSPDSRASARVLYRPLLTILVIIMAVFAVILPLLGNQRYRQALSAYQERNWETAVDRFAEASRWEPLNAKYYQLRGEALVNLGRYEEAVQAYERAERRKRGFVPYLSQLGWLYWLQGDLDRAAAQFQRAAELDPREAWRPGLHAALGLAYVAQGRSLASIPMFAETIEQDPTAARAAYWLPVQRADGGFEVVLDPAYLPGAGEALTSRILAHLGQADYTPRLFEPIGSHGTMISLGQVLDVVEEEYKEARAVGSREAPRLLATVAQAAQLAGLHGRSERAYQAFQEDQPQSAYGYRGLASLHREQDRPQEAQEALEEAVGISPRDRASWYALSELYLERSVWNEAEGALRTISRIDPVEARQYELWARLYQARGELANAVAALQSALVVEESVPNRLKLAGLLRELGSPVAALDQCMLALDVSRNNPLRPLDPVVWEIGLCVAASPDGDLPQGLAELVRDEPMTGSLLDGHIHRARGELDAALEAYQTAAQAGPDEGGPHYLLGETHQALGQRASAEAEYRLAAQLDPLESLPLLALAELQRGQGQIEAALQSYSAAVQATPGWAPALISLGNALLAAGDREGADGLYHRAALIDRGLHDGLIYDFAAGLAEAELAVPGPEYVRADLFTIDGDTQRVLFMHPDSRVGYRLDLPIPDGAEPGAGKVTLALAIAMKPDSWAQPGDGATFAVYVDAGAGASQVFSAYIDPKQQQADRRWHFYQVDLSAYAGQTVVVAFETGGGPSGDLRFDWAGWGSPRLLVSDGAD